MPMQRPGAATAAGVLCIIYGSLFTLCGVCAVAGLAAQGGGANLFAGGDPLQQKLQEDLMKAVEKEAPGYAVAQYVSTFGGLTLSMLILISGINLIRMLPSARTLTLVVVWIAIVFTVLQTVYQVAFVMPAMDRAFQVIFPAAMPAPPPAQMMQALRGMMTIITFATIAVYALVAAYLMVILILLYRGNVREAYEAAARGEFLRPADEFSREERRPRDDRSDDDWDYQPPRDDFRSTDPRDDRIK